MALGFRRRIKLAPGIHLNLSTSGASVSAGGHGATVNLNSSGIRTTLSVPGTGLSYTEAVPWTVSARHVASISMLELITTLRAMAQVEDPSIRDEDPVTLTVTLPPRQPGTQIASPVVRPAPQGGGFLLFILIFLPIFVLWVRVLRGR